MPTLYRVLCLFYAFSGLGGIKWSGFIPRIMLVGLVLGDWNADGADDADFHGFLFVAFGG